MVLTWANPPAYNRVMNTCRVCKGKIPEKKQRGPKRIYCGPRCRQIAADLSEARKLSLEIESLPSDLFDQFWFIQYSES